ncbi:MAG: hypothetical protein JSU70_17500 [Phycisphaerales bacterium]|nr:MAG: hypothetical protein JSU70_17500 [Phycisphaerales bacterium]
MKSAKILLAIVCCLILVGVSVAKKDDGCVTIQDGLIEYSPGHYLAGTPIQVGYDPFGYNYQAHLFNGSYANVYLGRDGLPPYEGDTEAYLADNPDAVSKWYWPYRDVDLEMKWNDAWLSNKDCDGDGALDRHYGFASYIGSGAWETNHMSGGEGEDHWTYFTKIIAVPGDAELVGGIWYTADGTEIGPEIWGSFATILEVESGAGATYVSPAGPGFGKW